MSCTALATTIWPTLRRRRRRGLTVPVAVKAVDQVPPTSPAHGHGGLLAEREGGELRSSIRRRHP